jgi:hypothetical protein
MYFMRLTGINTDINYIARAGSLDFSLVRASISRFPMSHPVDHSRSIVSDRPYRPVSTLLWKIVF